MSIIRVNKKITILISVFKNKKTNGSLGNFYVDDWDKKREIRIGNIVFGILWPSKSKQEFYWL